MVHIGCVHWENLIHIQQELQWNCRIHLQDHIDGSLNRQNYEVLLYRYSPRYQHELPKLRILSGSEDGLPVIIATRQQKEIQQWVMENELVNNCTVIPPKLNRLVPALHRVIQLGSNDSAGELLWKQGAVQGLVRQKRMDPASEFIHRRFREKIRVRFLAELCCMSEITFLRNFKKEYGMTPRIYIKLYRLNHAKQLLRDTTLNVQQIAADCGFSESSFFIRLFRRHTGMTPSQYRKQAATRLEINHRKC